MLLSDEWYGNKAKLPLCLIKHNAMKTYAGVEVQFHQS
jgi:hypothetical protein